MITDNYPYLISMKVLVKLIDQNNLIFFKFLGILGNNEVKTVFKFLIKHCDKNTIFLMEFTDNN